VRLRLRGADQVETAAREMFARLSAAGFPPQEFLVQQMAQPGVEMLVGVVHDPHFGPVIACGAGGVTVELLRDVSVRLTPLSRVDASEMIRDLKTYPLLAGFRRQPPADAAALEEILVAVSALADDLPEIAELDCNPVIVHQRGATVVDARIRVAERCHRRPWLPGTGPGLHLSPRAAR
jgi:acyl-CoA synthetase (NDP forming)